MVLVKPAMAWIFNRDLGCSKPGRARDAALKFRCDEEAQAETHPAMRDRRIFYRWLWLVYAPWWSASSPSSCSRPGRCRFLALPFVALLALDAVSIRSWSSGAAARFRSGCPRHC